MGKRKEKKKVEEKGKKRRKKKGRRDEQYYIYKIAEITFLGKQHILSWRTNELSGPTISASKNVTRTGKSSVNPRISRSPHSNDLDRSTSCKTGFLKRKVFIKKQKDIKTFTEQGQWCMWERGRWREGGREGGDRQTDTSETQADRQAETGRQAGRQAGRQTGS